MCAVTVKLKELMSTDALLLTFGNMKDEEALVRDSHQAATPGTQQRSTATLTQTQASKLRKCTLSDVHKHFVNSANRRFITPIPEGSSRQYQKTLALFTQAAVMPP
ncbi:hypothetical protein WJX77_006218 [Trebouxia sp. C0004]